MMTETSSGPSALACAGSSAVFIGLIVAPGPAGRTRPGRTLEVALRQR
jgi:hypothetical protein